MKFYNSMLAWLEDKKIKYFFSKKNKPDLIITDKNKLALLLKYDINTMCFPVILEKGRNSYAEKIICVSYNKNIPVVENRKLANDLYCDIKKGQEISPKYYNIIATIYTENNFSMSDKNREGNYSNNLFDLQRQLHYETINIYPSEKIKMELGHNILPLINNRNFQININGFTISNILINEDKTLHNNEYRIKINGLLVKQGDIKYCMIEPFNQLTIHLSEALRSRLVMLIGRDEIVYLLSRLKEEYPILVQEVIKLYSIGEIQKIFKKLMQENVPMQHIVLILETMADFENKNHDIDLIVKDIIGKLNINIAVLSAVEVPRDVNVNEIKNSVRKNDDKNVIYNCEYPDKLSLEIGCDLIRFMKIKKGVGLLESLQEKCRQFALEMGVVVPKIRIIYNKSLSPLDYCIKIHGTDVGKNSLKDDTENVSIIATYFNEIIHRHSVEFLGLQETQDMIDSLGKDYPALIDEIIKLNYEKILTLGIIKKVLHGLLREEVSIKNMAAILESIADSVHLYFNTRFLIEKARMALAKQICSQYADDNRALYVLTLEPSLEQKIVDYKVWDYLRDDYISLLEPTLYNAWIRGLARSIREINGRCHSPVILCTYLTRYLVRSTLEREFPEVAVLSTDEIITSGFTVESLGVITLDEKVN